MTDTPLRYDTVSFLSDYGHTDEFVGIVHSVIRQLAPAVRVIDITHEVPAYDVRSGALALGRAAQYLAPGVVVAVVDPGVGTSRRAIAVEVGDGQSVLIGPDNGVLAAAVAVVGGATRAFHLNDPEFHLAAPGPLFDGRDIFAPVAAHLCNGVPLEAMGEQIEPAGLMPATLPISERTEDGVTAEVLWIDRYGNLQLNADPDEVGELGELLELRVERPGTAPVVRTVRRTDTFAEVGAGALGLVLDSYGALAIVMNRSSAAEELQLGTGQSVQLRPLDDDETPVVTTQVQLGAPRR
ncbi:MAG: SAM hydrolase/SAM-dependent halogenase family protein [Microthrixaceae bacterium]